MIEDGIGGPRRNLELKAHDRDPARSVEVCRRLGAEDLGTLTQRDTYFKVPRGRLKLREEPEAVGQLIAYEREDRAGNRESRFRLVAVPDPAGLIEALDSTLGIAVVVSKKRRLFRFEGVRIHLDRVDGLGDFIEFEGVAGADDPARFAELLDDLRTSFGIGDRDLVPGSYADLLPQADSAANSAGPFSTATGSIQAISQRWPSRS